MNTKAIGDITTAMVLATLLRAGRVVLLPFGDNQRYDLVIDDGGSFLRVQCKTGRLTRGKIVFPTCSSYAHRGGRSRTYAGQIELFGVYCPELGTVYLVPVQACGSSSMYLRVDQPKNGQVTGIRWARDFLLK